jgi:membrane protein
MSPSPKPQDPRPKPRLTARPPSRQRPGDISCLAMFKRILRRAWSVTASTLTGWQKDGGSLMAAAIAYYATFSLLPLCLVLIAGLGFVGRYSAFVQAQRRDLLDRVSHNVSPWLADALQNILADAEARAIFGGPLGLLVLLLVGLGIFLQLEGVFDRIWSPPSTGERHELGGAKKRPSLWRRVLALIRAALWDRLLAFLTLLAIGGLLIAVSLANVILVAIRPFLAQLPAGPSAWHTVQWISTIGCDAVLLGTIYRVLPKPRVRWRDALCGGLLAAVVWAIGRYLLLLLLADQQYSAYGLVGVLMGVMLWFYYASAVVFLGAEFVHALGSPATFPEERA